MAASSAVSPTANVMLPHQSIRTRCLRAVSLSEAYDQIVPAMPIGTLTRKTARQSHSDSSPPATSPMNEPASAATWLIPSAMPRSCAPNASVRIAVELAISIAPPTPCTTRQPMSQSAPAARGTGRRDSSTAAIEKTRKPRL